MLTPKELPELVVINREMLECLNLVIKQLSNITDALVTLNKATLSNIELQIEVTKRNSPVC